MYIICICGDKKWRKILYFKCEKLKIDKVFLKYDKHRFKFPLKHIEYKQFFYFL